jgi:hypothetical protein
MLKRGEERKRKDAGAGGLNRRRAPQITACEGEGAKPRQAGAAEH